MSNKKVLLICVFIILVLGYMYFSIYTNIFDNNALINCLVIVSALLLGLYLIILIFSKDKNSNFNSKDKLFNSLVESSDTIYIMINSKNNKVMYLSKNIEEVLGVKLDERPKEELVFEILNIPIIKSELNNWDKVSSYVSQMIEYDNPKYNYQMWVKIKINPYIEDKDKYFIVQITDATKEHDRQHLLISQASDIKTRESQLNQITEASYDMEIDINLITNTYHLKYFKKDNLYFGEEKSGNYAEGLNEILKYINENDREMVLSNLSIDNLKDHFSKYELNSIVIRYRLGNEVKNNTWLESTIFFLSNRQKMQVSILTKNVTESAESIREQNIMLQNALNDAKIADKAKTDLISTISHDIRTPLTNIIGLSDSLLSKNLDDDIHDDIKNINDSSNEVLSIIDGLLDPSKIAKKVIEKEEKNYSILKMFKKVEESAKEYIGNKPIKFNLNLDNNLPVILFGDYKRITQSLIKIVNNSIKYTDEGEINLSVRGKKNGNNVNLIVVCEDTGTGIEDSKLNEIINSKDMTTGLGTVKDLMKLLDGKLEIESKVGEYTKVTVSFVQKIVEDNKVREMMKINKQAEEFSLKGKKVLIVDDNKLNLKVTNRMLEPYELDVTLIESGEECIDLLKEQNNFDLILLDQMMPGLDGISTLNKIKELDGFNIPVIALTADAMEGQKEKYLANGFDDYISKPIDKGELSRVLKKFLKDK